MSNITFTTMRGVEHWKGGAGMDGWVGVGYTREVLARRGGALSCISFDLEQVGLLVICYSRLLARRKYRIQKRHAYTLLLLLRICQTWTVHQGGLAGRWME